MNDAEVVVPQAPNPLLAAEPPKPTLRRLFFGDDGLRAGWSFVLFLLILFALAKSANFIIEHFHLLPKPSRDAIHQPMAPHTTVIGEGLQFAFLLFVSWLMSLIERRPLARYGLSLRRALPDFFTGIFWGVVSLSTLIGMLLLTHAIAFDGIALHGSTALFFAAKWALAFLFVGLLEEFLTRGYIQYTVTRGVAGIVRTMSPNNRFAHPIGFAVAAFLFSVCLFMSGHLLNPGETVPGIIAVGLAGSVFAFSLYRTGTLWWAIGVHAAWDWCQTYLYGVRDSGIPAIGHFFNSHPTGRTLLSGGSTGPEGSLLVIPTLLALAAVIHFTLPRRPYPLTPDQAPPLAPTPVPYDLSPAPESFHLHSNGA